MIFLKEMVTCLKCCMWLMTVAMVTCGDLASDERCADIELEGLTNGDNVTVKQYSYINLTFHLNTSKCPDIGESIWLKVSVTENEHSDNFCMVVMLKGVCRPTDGSNCQCLSDPRGWVRMSRFFNVSGQVPIVWRWGERESGKHQGNASIMVDVFNDFHSEEETTIFKADGADLEFPDFREDETVRILVHSVVNVTFHLNSSSCSYSPEWFRLKGESAEDQFNVAICNIIFQGDTCNLRDQSTHCRCLQTRSARLHTRLDKLGRVVYIWSLSDLTRDKDQKKTQITFNVVRETESRSEGINVNIIILYSSCITAAVIIIPIAIIIGAYLYRRRKGLNMIVIPRMSRRTADDGRRQIPDISPHVQENRNTPAKDEDEYSEIAEEMASRDSSPARVHENYEHPLQEEGEDQSEYSRLEYKSLRQNGNGNDKDGSNIKLGDLSSSTVAVKEQQTDTRVTVDEYLEPMPSCKEAVT